MAETSTDRDVLLNELADDFAARYRRGERPSLTEYAAKHPELADEIREFFPAVVEIEGAKAEGPPAVAESHLPPLEQLGDFQILREIGHGGMGVVYEAQQISLGRRVALKLLTQRMLRDGVQKRRFEREAKAAARLHHTNIVPVFGSGEHEGTPYYVMQFIQGLGLDVVADEVAKIEGGSSVSAERRDVSNVTRSLMTGEYQPGESSERGVGGPPSSRAVADTSGVTMSMTRPDPLGGTGTRKSRRFTYCQGVARIGVQVADALEHAHRQGIVHRDIKPSNLLLDLSGTAWVTDFGLAKSEDQDNLTRTGDMLGTLRYMPPEAFDGKSDLRGDVYGLGITLYELLALRPAFDERERSKLIKAVTTGEPPRLRRVRPSVPRDLEIIVHKAIDREPGRRYRSAAELAADLQRFLGDEPIRAREISTCERIWRWCRRNPALAAVSGLALFLLCALGVGGSISAKVYRDQRDTALSAREAARQSLRDSRLAEARALRIGGQSGRRFAALRSLAAAAEIQTGPDLRGEAIAAMGLCDVEFEPIATVANSDACAIDATATRYAHWAEDGTIWIGRVGVGGDPVRLPGPGHRPFVIDFSRDGRYLAAKYHRASDDGNNVCIVWDLNTGREAFRTPGPVVGLSFGPGSLFAATLREGRVVVFDLPDGRERAAFPLNQPGRVTFDAAGRRLACAPNDSGPIQIFSLDGAEPVQLSQPSSVRGMDFSPDGETLAAAAADKKVYLWDLRTREPRILSGHTRKVTQVAFSSTGDRLASTGWDEQLIVWQPHTGEMLHKMPGNICQLRFAVGDQFLGVAGVGRQLYRIRFAAGRECRRAPFDLTQQKRLWGVDLSPEGRLLSLASDEGVRFFDLDAECFVGGVLPTGPARTAAFAGDGSALITWSGTGLQRWPMSRSDGTIAFGPPQSLGVSASLNFEWGALSRDGRIFVAADRDRSRVTVVDLRSASILRTISADNPSRIAIDSSGRRLALSSWNAAAHYVRCWDVATGERTLDAVGDNRSFVAFSPDGQRLSVGGVGNLREYDFRAATWSSAVSPFNARVEGVAWSPDGSAIAFDREPGSVSVIRADGGREIATFPGGSPMGFSRDGTRLFTLGPEVWDLAAVRRQLADLGLDWDAPPLPVRERSGFAPLRVEIAPGK